MYSSYIRVAIYMDVILYANNKMYYACMSKILHL